MVRKFNRSEKWNFPPEKAIEIIHENLINILRENELMEIPNIINLLNIKTKKLNFKRYGKRKDVIVYINEYFSSLITFADSYEIYCVIYKDKKAHIKLNEEIDFNGKNIKKKELSECWSWDFIDVPSILELN